MLKGHVFNKQVFESPMFALFLDTFLNGKCGIVEKYNNGMSITTSAAGVSISSGVAFIKGRIVEEDSSTSISVSNDTSNPYCKLVIEIDLSKQNTDESLNQAYYKIVRSASDYPDLIKEDISLGKGNVYQFELARFKTSADGITDFQDTRTFLDFATIYDIIPRAIISAKIKKVDLSNYLDVSQGQAITLEEAKSVDSTKFSFDGSNSISIGKGVKKALISVYCNFETEGADYIALSKNGKKITDDGVIYNRSDWNKSDYSLKALIVQSYLLDVTENDKITLTMVKDSPNMATYISIYGGYLTIQAVE